MQLKQGFDALQRMALADDHVLKTKKLRMSLVLNGKVKCDSVRVNTEKLHVCYSSNRENIEFWRCNWLTQLAIIALCLSDWYKLPVTVFYNEEGDIVYRKGQSKKVYLHIPSLIG
jgi:hypothetical protein